MDQARETLELVVGEGDSGPTLRSPGVGRARITLPRRAFVGPGSRVGELLTVTPTPMLTALAKKYGEGEGGRDERVPSYQLKVERIRHRLEESAGASGMISAVLA